MGEIMSAVDYERIEENAFSLEQDKIRRVNVKLKALHEQIAFELRRGVSQRISDCLSELSDHIDDATHDSSFDALVKEIEG